MMNPRALLVFLAACAVLIAVCGHARAADCPPYVAPSQVNCDQAKGYLAGVPLRQAIRQALACGYRVYDIYRTIKRCGLK